MPVKIICQFLSVEFGGIWSCVGRDCNIKAVLPGLKSRISTTLVSIAKEHAPGLWAKRGVVQFVGKAESLAPGFWVRVQYDEPLGKHDGIPAHLSSCWTFCCRVKGTRYFKCPSLHGAMVRPDKVKAFESNCTLEDIHHGKQVKKCLERGRFVESCLSCGNKGCTSEHTRS